MKILTILLLVVVFTPAIAKTRTSPVRVISTQSDIFYFKVDKSFMGAVLEVYSQGSLISTDTITHHRNIIDFYLENAGTYEIKIKKDGREETFTYEKAELIAPYESISVLVLHP